MRYPFGGTLADWTFDPISVGEVDNVVHSIGNVEITCWSERVGGQRYTDLLDADGQPVSHVLSSGGDDGAAVGQIPVFFGPDDVPRMWVAAGGGPRALILAHEQPSTDVVNDPAKLDRSLYSRRGVLLAASAADGPVPVDPGLDGSVLTADSAAAAGVRWASSALAGSILAWTGNDYAPAALKTDTSRPRLFVGPVDPATVTGVVMSTRDWHDTWIGSAA